MEKEISKIGIRSGTTARNDISFNNFSLPPLPFSNYAGDLGFTAYRPLEKEMMMMSRVRHSDLVTDHQDLMDRQHAVLSYMEELRKENISLKMVNTELTNRLSLFSSVGFSGLGPGSAPVEGSEGFEVDRVSLPKSISVRSDRNPKTVQTGGSSGGQIHKQRVYVSGREKDKQPIELEVYNQGMFKTELCNKETGACPYVENCQFAHGITELRPILRHPRYKTEVCRMVLNGDPCPYGHRCHFRHTLTDEENLIRSMNIRSLKPLNR